MSRTAGWFRISPRPSGLQASVTMPCAALKAASAVRGRVGSSSIWLTAGVKPASKSFCRCASVKFDTPAARTSPASTARVMPSKASTKRPWSGLGQWISRRSM